MYLVEIRKLYVPLKKKFNFFLIFSNVVFLTTIFSKIFSHLRIVRNIFPQLCKNGATFIQLTHRSAVPLPVFLTQHLHPSS